LSLCGLAVVAVGWALVDQDTVAGADAPAAGVVAKVGDIEITEADLEASAAEQLMEVDRKRHQILEGALGSLIDEKLMEVEAEARGLTVDELAEQEIVSKVAPVTDGEVDVFYDAQKAQINQPKEQVAEQIRSYLARQRQQETGRAYLKTLKEKYEVTSYLDPLRVDVAAADSPGEGPVDALVTIVEFSDFQCPYCARVTPTLDRVREEYGDKVRVVFKQFPLPSHGDAQKAAEASLCANDQGKFWEMHDSMFATQRALGVDQLKAKAVTLELDTEQFDACLDNGEQADQVAADLALGRQAGVNSTPSLFINGRFLAGAVPFENMAAIIDDELRRIEAN